MVAARHLSLALSAGDARQLVAGVIVAGAAFGVLVGAAIRSQSSTVIAIFASSSPRSCPRVSPARRAPTCHSGSF